MHFPVIRLWIPAVAGSLLWLSAAALARGPVAAPPGASLSVLFDNTTRQTGCTAGWGFSALIAGVGRTILFDTGAQAPVLRANLSALHADLKAVDLLFLSHDHSDHTAGLEVMLQQKPGVPIFVPAGASAEFQSDVRGMGGQVSAVRDPQLLAPGIWSTGDLGEAIHEQALVLDTPRGLVVVTGCAHPGIVSIVERARAVGKKDVWMVLGGFHLYQSPPQTVDSIIARFKALGVQRVGATHCTGDAAIAAFRRAFGAGFVELGVGAVVQM
jgi:7,8-dihydropterin-6-yl-methyl-4-(beta-D-ribofuranosyl)aminobenzene 5'-phosphate synthase